MIIFIMVISLLLASSTGAILTLLVLLIYHYFSRTKRNFFKFTFSFLVLASVIIAISFTEKISAQIGSLEYLDINFIQKKQNIIILGVMDLFVWRLVYWVQILQNFLANNSVVLFFGEGIDTLTKDNYLYSFIYTDPHNDFLKYSLNLEFLVIVFICLFSKDIYYFEKI